MRRFAVAVLIAFAACRREPPPATPAAPPPGERVLSEADERASLTNIARGATIISRTAESFFDASAADVIDGDPNTCWISPPHDWPQTIVIGLAARTRVDRVGFRTASAPYAARQVQIDASTDEKTWRTLTTVTAAEKDDPQWFDVAPAEAAFLRVTLLDARPAQTHLRLASLLARGTELEPPRRGPIDGCWSLNGRPARFAQRGARVVGAIAIGQEPLFLDGAADERAIRFVWVRGNDYGYALMTVSPDGRHLTALEWHEEAIPLFHGEPWFGERAACSAPEPREDVALALLRRTGRYSLFALDGETVEHLAKLLAALRVPSRIVVHELREATPQANKERAQRTIETLRAALGPRAGSVPFIAAGSDAPRQQPATEAARALYSSVDLEIRR